MLPQVLQKHFGLEAFFAPTRKTAGSNAPWTEDPNHKWHVSEELKTTICYLTLPYKASSKQNFESSEMEEDCGSWLVEGTQSSFVELPTLANRAKRVKQFRHALRSLMLAPYVHPSQLNDTVTAEVAGKCVEGKEEDDSDRKMSDGCTKGLSQLFSFHTFITNLRCSCREERMAAIDHAREDRRRQQHLKCDGLFSHGLTTIAARCVYYNQEVVVEC